MEIFWDFLIFEDKKYYLYLLENSFELLPIIALTLAFKEVSHRYDDIQISSLEAGNVSFDVSRKNSIDLNP